MNYCMDNEFDFLHSKAQIQFLFNFEDKECIGHLKKRFDTLK